MPCAPPTATEPVDLLPHECLSAFSIPNIPSNMPCAPPTATELVDLLPHECLSAFMISVRAEGERHTKEGKRPDRERRWVYRPAGSGGPSPLVSRP
eukprot:1177720-Prorocentrum_minimum.AAC.7